MRGEGNKKKVSPVRDASCLWGVSLPIAFSSLCCITSPAPKRIPHVIVFVVNVFECLWLKKFISVIRSFKKCKGYIYVRLYCMLDYILILITFEWLVCWQSWFVAIHLSMICQSSLFDIVIFSTDYLQTIDKSRLNERSKWPWSDNVNIHLN